MQEYLEKEKKAEKEGTLGDENKKGVLRTKELQYKDGPGYAGGPGKLPFIRSEYSMSPMLGSETRIWVGGCKELRDLTRVWLSSFGQLEAAGLC